MVYTATAPAAATAEGQGASANVSSGGGQTTTSALAASARWTRCTAAHATRSREPLRLRYDNPISNIDHPSGLSWFSSFIRALADFFWGVFSPPSPHRSSPDELDVRKTG